AFVEGWAPLARWGAAFVAPLALNLAAYVVLARIYAGAQAARSRLDLDELRELAGGAAALRSETPWRP
ncbi:MAG TPA: hypothetical protein PKD53_30040, partial [Chloroflexaceae bacterium]|nr:hypothetical protein [Chloroflexaceae bacterium]